MMRGLVWLTCLVMIGCTEPERNATPAEGGASDDAVVVTAATSEPTVLMLGTSLTAGLGLQPDDAIPALIQQRVDSAGLSYRVVNAGVSGETSAGALRRLDWLMRQSFDVLVLETGANDMLRGMDLDSTRANIQGIIDRVRERRPEARIVLVGMLAPPNLGPEYTGQFRDLYPTLAAENDIPLVPFLLEGVGGVAAFNQADGIHPNEEGAMIAADNVWHTLGPVLVAAAIRTSDRP